MSFHIKRSPINWLAFTGICLSFIGSFFLAFDSNPNVHTLNAQLTGYDNVDKGWQALTSFTLLDTAGNHIGAIAINDPGFQRILEIILANRQEYATQRIRAIVDSNPIGLTIGKGDVSPRAISLAIYGETQTEGIASEETVKQWIDSTRRSDLLSFASRFIFAGFLLSLLGQLFQPKIKRKIKRSKLGSPTDSTPSGSLTPTD